MAELIVRAGLLIAAALAASVATWWIRSHYRAGPLPLSFDRTDAQGAGTGPMIVEFTSPYCHDCIVALPILEEKADEHGAVLAVIDASKRPDLAAKYSIRSTPTIFVVDRRNKVVGGWFSPPDRDSLDRYLTEVSGF